MKIQCCWTEVDKDFKGTQKVKLMYHCKRKEVDGKEKTQTKVHVQKVSLPVAIQSIVVTVAQQNIYEKI